jgi:hypothetical protein
MNLSEPPENDLENGGFGFCNLFRSLGWHAEFQLIPGHARRETLTIYQQVVLGGELEAKYQHGMKKSDL